MGRCLAYLEDEEIELHPSKDPKGQKGPKTCRRYFSIKEQERIILLRFGSLTDDSHQAHTPTEVLYRTGVRLSTQCNIVDRWRKRGFLVYSSRR